MLFVGSFALVQKQGGEKAGGGKESVICLSHLKVPPAIDEPRPFEVQPEDVRRLVLCVGSFQARVSARWIDG